MIIAGQRVDLRGFHLFLSQSRRPALVWSYSQDQLSWLCCHNRAFERDGGIPAVLRVDNTKTTLTNVQRPGLLGGLIGEP